MAVPKQKEPKSGDPKIVKLGPRRRAALLDRKMEGLDHLIGVHEYGYRTYVRLYRLRNSGLDPDPGQVPASWDDTGDTWGDGDDDEA